MEYFCYEVFIDFSVVSPEPDCFAAAEAEGRVACLHGGYYYFFYIAHALVTIAW